MLDGSGGGGSFDSADAAMARYAAGDEMAFHVIYSALATPLTRYARRLTRNDQAAQDAVQETFTNMHRFRASFVPGARVRPWAYSILRNAAADQRRRVHEVPGGDDVPADEERSPEPGADDAISMKEQEVAAQRCLDAMKPALREAFELVKLEGVSVAEAAEILGVSRTLVKVRVFRAKAALKNGIDS